jgi:hypothetical protein
MADNIKIIGNINNIQRINRLNLKDLNLLNFQVKNQTFGFENDYIEYKKHKRSFYSIITHFYSNFKGEVNTLSDLSEEETEEDLNKLIVFDVLIKLLKTQKRIYKLDEELKGLSKK